MLHIGVNLVKRTQEDVGVTALGVEFRDGAIE